MATGCWWRWTTSAKERAVILRIILRKIGDYPGGIQSCCVRLTSDHELDQVEFQVEEVAGELYATEPENRPAPPLG